MAVECGRLDGAGSVDAPLGEGVSGFRFLGCRVSETLDGASQGLQFKDSLPRHRQVKKTYMAVVCGRLDGAGGVDAPLDGKPSLTRWRAAGHTRSAQHQWVTTVHLHPHTGNRVSAEYRVFRGLQGCRIESCPVECCRPGCFRHAGSSSRAASHCLGVPRPQVQQNLCAEARRACRIMHRRQGFGV